VAHTLHQFLQAGISGSGHRVSGVPQIMKVQFGHAIARPVGRATPGTDAERKGHAEEPIALHSPTLGSTSHHGFREARFSYQIFYQERPTNPAANCQIPCSAGRSQVASVSDGRILPSWSCGFDSRRPLQHFRGIFRTLLGDPLGPRVRCESP